MTTYIICGPTASGKSALAIDIARHQTGHVINSDSMQVYKELPILSAQPVLLDQQEVPHLLYGLLSVTEVSSVGKWLNAANQAIKKPEVTTPVFVGGTGLYTKSLLEGLSPIPDIPASVREEIALAVENAPKGHLFQMLKKEDPLTAQNIDPQNTQRILRALEVIRHTQKPLAEWQKLAKEKLVQLPQPIKVILIDPDRETLYQKINDRVEHMLEQGAIKEVLKLKENHIIPSTTAHKTLGYEEISAYIDGHLSRSEMIEQIQQKTRHYAKRQMTWFRNQFKPDFIWSKIYGVSDWPEFVSKMEW